MNSIIGLKAVKEEEGQQRREKDKRGGRRLFKENLNLINSILLMKTKAIKYLLRYSLVWTHEIRTGQRRSFVRGHYHPTDCPKQLFSPLIGGQSVQNLPSPL